MGILARHASLRHAAALLLLLAVACGGTGGDARPTARPGSVSGPDGASAAALEPHTCLDQPQAPPAPLARAALAPAEAGVTRISVDGESADWAPYPALGTDPAGDGEAGQFDITAVRLFTNHDALYLLVEAAPGSERPSSFELDLWAGEHHLRVGWNVSPWPYPWLGDHTGEWVDLEDANRSSVALASAYELRADLRTLGASGAPLDGLRVDELRVNAGECCNETWRTVDTWTTDATVPVVDEHDPPALLAEPQSAAEAAVLLASPDTRAIALDYDAGTRRVRISAGPGAVPPNAMVLAGSMEVNDFRVLRADAEGAFSLEVEGAPGTHVLIKQDSVGNVIRFEDPIGGEGMTAPGVLLQVPAASVAEGIPFGGGGRLCCDNAYGISWTLAGSYEREDLRPGERMRVQGTATLYAGEGVKPPNVSMDLSAFLVADERGRQVGPNAKFASSFLTPTGVAIERTMSGPQAGQTRVGGTKLSWRWDGSRWTADFSAEVKVPSELREGHYQLAAGPLWLNDVKLEPSPLLTPFDAVVRDDPSYRAAVGLVRVGEPAPVRLVTTLLGDLVSEGTRGGILATEDAGLFDISPRDVTRHDSVVPHADPYGTPFTYRLEPFVPLVDVADRALPNPPSIEPDLARSVLTVTVERPDGGVDVLGPAPLTRYGVGSPITAWGSPLGPGGGELREVARLMGDGDDFAYAFPASGQYTVRLDGAVADVTGRVHGICATFPVTVGNVLDIELGLMPGTPFEVGDALPPTLTVQPAVPADITYTVTLVGPDGEETARTFAGTAGAGGWWDGGGETFVFAHHGEYRVDVDARYVAPSGELWAGRLRAASVVATPDGPISAHGRRGPDNQAEIAPPWAFETAFTMNASDHMQFPYFNGDVLWGVRESDAGDAVVTHASFRVLDPTNPLAARALRQALDRPRWMTPSAEELERAGQLPLVLSSEPQDDDLRGAHPDDLTLWAYAYSIAVRPGVRVREVIQGDDISGTYWRFDDAYHGQSGNGPQGDLPGDVKFFYIGAVLRDPWQGQGAYAIQGSGWVHATDEDPLGSRFMPPFQGAAGGPDGGPLFTVHEREVDLFFHPMGIRPGALVEVGDAFRMAGPLMPTLPSLVAYTVTAPSGRERTFEARANAVGYLYDPADDFTLDEPGLWTVSVHATHDGMTSAGPVEPPYPTGGVLAPDGETFTFTVRDGATLPLALETELEQVPPNRWFDWVAPARFTAPLPEGFAPESAHVSVTMPGVVLVDAPARVEDGALSWLMEPKALARLAHNFDAEWYIADTLTVTFTASGTRGGAPAQAAGTLVTHGVRVPRAR
jgi:hypothetical protein